MYHQSLCESPTGILLVSYPATGILPGYWSPTWLLVSYLATGILPGYWYPGRQQLSGILAVAELEAQTVGYSQLIYAPARPETDHIISMNISTTIHTDTMAK